MIQPFTNIDDPMQDPSGILGAGMLRPPTTEQIVDTALPMPPGAAGAGVPPELAQAQQVLAQADAIMGPSAGSSPAGAPGAPPPPAPATPGSAAPAPTPPIPTTTAGQRQYLREQQFAGLAEGQRLDTREQQLAQEQAGVRTGGAAISAAQANLQDVNQQRQQEELQAAQNLFAGKLASARQASDQATQTWLNAKPADWFKDSTVGAKLATSFGIALAMGVDQMNANRGVRSNLGQQAVQLVHEKIDQQRAEEIARIENLKQRAVSAGQDVGKLEHAYAVETARIEQKYAGIEKALEMRARSERAALGMEQARIEGDQLVVAQARRAEEAQARRLDAVNRFVNAETALEMRGRRGGGRGGGKGGPTDPSDPYAGMTPNARHEAMRDRDAREIFNLDGSPAGLAKTVAEGKKLRDAQQAGNNLIDGLERLASFVEREGTTQVPIFESGARKERENITRDIAGALTIIRQTGILQPTEAAAYDKLLTPSNWQSSKSAIDGIRKQQQAFAEQYARKVRAQGATTSTPGSQGPTQPETMPAMRPQGTSTWPPADIEMLQKARAGHPRANEILDKLRRRYGAEAVDGR